MDLSFIAKQKELGEQLVQKALKKNWMLVIGESCTGGIISSIITSVPGSSKVFDQGLVTYSNKAKIDLLGVKETTLINQGAVSKEVVIEMVSGLFRISQANIALSISGVAGPGNLNSQKPEGLIWIAYGLKGSIINTQMLRINPLGRDHVRQKSSVEALKLLLKLLENS